MEYKQLVVVICSIIKDNSILLIERNKGEYRGKLALVGGKIEPGEHIKDAAKRETKEETGLDTKFSSLKGLISEVYKENKNKKHFLLYLTELIPTNAEIIESNEGKLKWVNLEKLEDYKDQLIPSDYMMIEEIVKNNRDGYFECEMEISQINQDLEIKRFEKII